MKNLGKKSSSGALKSPALTYQPQQGKHWTLVNRKTGKVSSSNNWLVALAAAAFNNQDNVGLPSLLPQKKAKKLLTTNELVLRVERGVKSKLINVEVREQGKSFIPSLAVLWEKEKPPHRPPRRKDGGVDVVAWRPFRDFRNGFPVYLVQVTCEKNYSHKIYDVDLRLWSGWLNLDADPVSVLAVPTTISPGEEWNEISSRVVVLERLRICELLSIISLRILKHSEKDFSFKVQE